MSDNKADPTEVMSFLLYLSNDAWKTKALAAVPLGVASLFVFKALKGAPLSDPEAVFSFLGLAAVGWFLAAYFINKRKEKLLSPSTIVESLRMQGELDKRLLLIEALMSLDNGEAVDPSMTNSLVNSLKGARGSALHFEVMKQQVTRILSGIARKANGKNELISALKDQHPDVRHCVSRALQDASIIPNSDVDQAHFYIALGRWETVSRLGVAAKDALVHALKYSNDSLERKKIIGALSAIGWEPDDAESKLVQYMANSDWERVSQMGAIAIDPCFALLREENWRNEDSVIETLRSIAVSDSVSQEDRNRIIRGLILELLDRRVHFGSIVEQALVRIGEPAVPLLIAAHNELINDMSLGNLDRYPGHYGGALRSVLIEIGPKAIPFIEKDLVPASERDAFIKKILNG